MVIIGSYSTVENRLITAAYYSSNILNKDVVSLKEIFEIFAFEANERYLQTSLKYLSENGFNKVRLTFDDLQEQQIWLTAEGLKEAERLIENRASDVLEFRRTKLDAPKNTVESTLWTGLPKEGVLSEQSVLRLKAALTIVEDAVLKSDATNEEKSQARSYIIAMSVLADAPEPPADLIWELVNRANQLSGIASLFVSIFTLFVSVAQ